MRFRFFGLVLGSLLLAGCSVFGDSGVESAPYTLISTHQDGEIEVRNYESMILVTTPMPADEQGSAFRRLFNYITGDNEGAREIAMTAPVFMNEQESSSSSNTDDQGMEISMTAPVFMDRRSAEPTMSFVMPAEFTMETTPKPTDPNVQIVEVTDWKVAAIHFTGTLSDGNVQEATEQLRSWLSSNGYREIGEPVVAGYNGPLTIPMFRKNEILIEVE